MPDIFDKTMLVLEKVMDLRVQNQEVISTNIANANTPGYSAVRLEFDQQLQQAVQRNGLKPSVTNPSHIPIGPGNLDQVEAEVIRTPDRTRLGDKNSVAVDQEMVNLAENQILYEAAVQMMNKKIALLKYIAEDKQ